MYSTVCLHFDVQPPNEEREFYVQYYPAVEETTELMRVLRDYGLYRYNQIIFVNIGGQCLGSI